jgi:uncharacterized protein (TIGR03083 family)
VGRAYDYAMDPIAEWTAARQRVADVVTSTDRAELRVPACPDWTVRQLLAHMVGLGTDVVAGDEPDDHNSAWTQRQVDERADATVADLLAEWDANADRIRGWMAENGARPLGDVIIHEQDLRGAVGVPGAQDTDGLHAIRDRMAAGFGQAVDGRPGIALVSPTWSWPADTGDAAVVLEASEFDLARALMSRRSEAQLRAWTVRGDVGPYLDAFAALGSLPENDLNE